MRRVFGLMLALALMGGAVAACGSSSGSKKSDTATTVASSGGSGGSGTKSSNSAVQKYCNDVNAFVAEANKDKGNPSALAGLSAKAQTLATDSTKLTSSGLSAADGEALSACAQKATAALTP